VRRRAELISRLLRHDDGAVPSGRRDGDGRRADAFNAPEVGNGRAR
jgi:hypothetical protein